MIEDKFTKRDYARDQIMQPSILMTAIIERKHPKLPRFVVVPSKAVARWKIEGTTVVEGSLNGAEMGRRTFKPWDDQRWFIELPEPLCRRAQVDTGDSVTITLRIAPADLPEELAQLIANDPMAKARWEKLRPSQQRMLRENVAAAKQPATRQRRAAIALSSSTRKTD